MKKVSSIKYQVLSIQKGFTLIELLIVIAIIGVLSALLMANFIGVRQRARDGQRKSDLNQIRGALEMYRSDIGSYPLTLLDCGGSISQVLKPVLVAGSLSDSLNLRMLAAIYMQKIPCDPLGGNYYYSSDGTTYTLSACLENTSDSQGTGTSPGGPSGCTSSFYYVLNNP